MVNQQDHEGSPTKQVPSMPQTLRSNLSPDQSSSTVASPPLGQNLPVDPSSSTALNLLTSSTTASLPLGPDIPVVHSSSTVASPPPNVNLSLGLGLITGAALPLGSSSSTGGVNRSLGLSITSAAASLGDDLSLGQPGGDPLVVASGSQVPSSSQNSRTPPRAINFQMNKISIGHWTQTAVHSPDLLARCYFVKKQFVWEIRDEEQTETGTKKQTKKMEINWGDVLSLQANDRTGCLEIELSKPPSFLKECAPRQALRWERVDHFSPNHPSSVCRRHKLYFDPGVLKTNYNKIIADSFWSRTLEVQFPSLPGSLFFEENPPVEDNSQNQLLGTQGTSQQDPQEDAKTGEKRKRREGKE
ncbi:unnamed protein product [Thlaspi arvense]|uniref:TRF2/HOY1 PH-like domain-containing protein n=1 Tax=Thlaspi arvense TaxID=13288 RepID=A0AAU9S6J5_THLAR|nr:unnamed protein product [Thlaspi arvense]